MSMDIMARLDWALTAGNLTQGARLTLILALPRSRP